MHAEPAPPNTTFFHRSGSTPNCCQRCWSVEPSRDCGVMKFVSGHIAYSRFGSTACDFLKKYWTCDPGASRPSGMMGLNSFVTFEPFQPVRDLGTVLSHAGTVPSQATLLSVGELVAAFVVSTTKHTNLLTPSVANLGSLSWIVVWYRPLSRPVPVGTAPPTGKMFRCSVSMRQLFHVSGSHPPGPVCDPRDTRPGSAMYWPQNDASPETAAAAWFVGNCSSVPVTALPPGAMLRPPAMR